MEFISMVTWCECECGRGAAGGRCLTKLSMQSWLSALQKRWTHNARKSAIIRKKKSTKTKGSYEDEHLQLEVTVCSEVERSISEFVEMTLGSSHTLLISRKGIERNCCKIYRQTRPRCEKICHFSGSRAKNQRHSEVQCFKSCTTFCFKERVRMEQREPPDSPSDRKLRDLASKWFIETQVQLIVQNGFFPTWFRGFISRKDAEETLREKELGCFLVRLSDKTIGYILSYKGSDRCRHFVISQSESGQFVVSGDTEGHNTLSDLIEYYKISPIEPFGEYLTSSCFEVLNEDFYDVIQISPDEKPAATARNARWQMKSGLEQPPTRPPKNNRTQEEVPPLPRRGRGLESGVFTGQDRVLYAQLRKQPPREVLRAQQLCQSNLHGDNARKLDRSTTHDQISKCSPPSGPDSVDSEPGLLEYKSRSLPLLDHSSDGEQTYRLSVPPDTPPRLSPKPIRQAMSYGPTPETAESFSRAPSSHSPDCQGDSSLYHLAGRPCSPHTTTTVTRSLTSASVYAEVSTQAFVGHSPHENTYELIPGQGDIAEPNANSNTYEPLEDMRPKHNLSSWGLKNDKWKWLFPEVKKKW